MQVLEIKTMFLEIQNMSCENDDQKCSKTRVLTRFQKFCV